MPGVESRQQPGAGAALVPLLDHVAAVTPGKHVASVASRSHVPREHLAEDAPAAVGLLLVVLVLVLVVLLAGRHVARVQHRGGGARHVAVVPAVLPTRALTLHHVIIVASVKLEYLESNGCVRIFMKWSLI